MHRSQLFPLLLVPILLFACKKEDEAEPAKQYDECGNEICQNCGGIINVPEPATAYVWVESTDYTAMSEAVRIYNADNPTQYRDIIGAMDDGLGSNYFCGNTTNGNVARFAVQPGTTLHWKAFNASHTREWEGYLRNPDCNDGTNCYSARITYPW